MILQLERELIRISENLPELLNRLRENGADEVTKALCLQEFIRIHTWNSGIPFYGKFELTPLCNLDCKMCYVHLEQKQFTDKKLLGIQQWKRLMKAAADEGMMVATLTGGECLIYPGFEKLYCYLQQLGVQVIVMTNGILMTEEKIRFFKEHPPKLLQISLYGSQDEAYERVTGHRQYKTVMNNIRAVQSAGLPLVIAVTPSIYMEEDAENIIRLLSDMQLSYNISCGLFDPYTETGRQGQAAEMSKEMYFKLYKLQAELKGRTLISSCADNLPTPEKRNDGGKGLLCGGGNNAFVINYKGMMYPCSMLQECGQNLLTQSFKESWNNIHIFAGAYQRPVECEGCQYADVCQNCVVEHAKDAPKGHASPAICAWGKRLVGEGFADFM